MHAILSVGTFAGWTFLLRRLPTMQWMEPVVGIGSLPYSCRISSGSRS